MDPHNGLSKNHDSKKNVLTKNFALFFNVYVLKIMSYIQFVFGEILIKNEINIFHFYSLVRTMCPLTET